MRCVPNVIVVGPYVRLSRVVARTVACGTLDATRATDVLPGRATTRRCDVVGAVALRARTPRVGVLAFVGIVAARAVGRGTTLRAGAILVVRVITLIGFDDCDGVTPGFKFVRI